MSEISQKPLNVPSGHTANASGPCHTYAYDNDEIDLFELVFRLWERKGLIVMVTLVTTLIAGIYAFTAKEQWTVKAYVSPPQMAQFDDYLQLRRAFARVSGINADPQAIANHLFSRFTDMVSSPNEKLTYLLETAYVKQQTESMDPQTKRVWLTEMADKGLVASPPDEKKTLPYFMVSVSANNPDMARVLLVNYVDRINEKVIQQDDTEFRNNLQAMILARKKEQLDIDFSLQADRTNQLANLTRSRSTAQRAGIKDYYANSASNGGTKIELANSVHQYMLGENFLSAEINSLIESPIVYPVRYHDISRELSLLEPLLQQQATAQVYRYQLSPGDDVKKDRPKKALILVLGTLLGGMMGIGAVLVTDGIARYRRS
ncbi:LPS O-antigen chain length determinant protein WzzB [Budvicia aquatica]|uniref:Chain-length determining protein n=1 Tax=Budvicia aquatica TaxID=82979 RepID=A0A2C6DRS4_9GAMM|nr:Wzz/FepE/Etk N-terminal domain-containing protein [Budvicia aquatica]PHI31524.1 chain-length determining protein [Budvicia aquatica]VFS51966.1 Polysaccharide antigen chain regulator [Budvicia aquatica]